MIFETVAQLKLATLTAGQLVSTKGYYASGDGGAADYIVAATQAVDGYGDHALAGGTVALLQVGTSVDVKLYGAKCDGVTEDAAAWQAALDAGVPLNFAGISLCDNQLTSSGKPVTIAGLSMEGSELRFTSYIPARTGLNITATNWTDFLRLKDLNITTSTGWAVGKTAIRLDGSSQVTPSTLGTSGTVGITGGRMIKRAALDNVGIQGVVDSATTGWNNGLHVTSLGWFSVNAFTWNGDFSEWTSGNGKGTAIRIDGDGIPVEIHLSDLRIYAATHGIYCPDYVEGLYVSDFDMVNVTYGIRGQYVPGESTMLEIDTGLLQASIGPGHVSCRTGGVVLFNTNQTTVSYCNIYLQPLASDSNFFGVYLKNGGANCISDTVVTNIMSNTNAAWGVALRDVGRSFVSNISSYSMDGATVYLGGSSDHNSLNGIYGHNQNWVVIGDAGSDNNTISDVHGITIGTALIAVDLNNVIVKKEYSGTIVVTLTGGAATETVDVPIPAAYFTATPTAGFLMSSGISLLMSGFYNSDSPSSTATNARFLVASHDGTAIGGGGYRFSFLLKE